jgi:hypothetical protein
MTAVSALLFIVVTVTMAIRIIKEKPSSLGGYGRWLALGAILCLLWISATFYQLLDPFVMAAPSVLTTLPDGLGINDLGGGYTSGTPLAGGGAGPGGRCPPGGVPPAEGTRGCAPSCNG